MKDAKTTIVNPVENHFSKKEHYKITFMSIMKVTRIINVTLVVNHLAINIT